MRQDEKNLQESEQIAILKQRLTWTVKEASMVTGISTDRIYRMINTPGCPFVFNVGKKCYRINVEKFRECMDKNVYAEDPDEL